MLIAYEHKYDYKHHCYSGSLDCLLPDLTLLTGAAMFKDTKSMMFNSEHWRLRSILSKRHLANGRMRVNQQGHLIVELGVKKVTRPSHCMRRKIRTRRADANLV